MNFENQSLPTYRTQTSHLTTREQDSDQLLVPAFPHTYRGPERTKAMKNSQAMGAGL